MFNILYVHGYNSNGNSRTAATLKANLPTGKYAVFSPSIDVSPDKSVEFIENFVKENEVDIIVGSSLGGFLTLAANVDPRITKIVINPSLQPSVTLPERGCDKAIAEKYVTYEQLLGVINPPNLYGIFATHDEIIDYRNVFKLLYKHAKFIEINDGHRISTENITNTLVPLIKGIV